MDSQAQTQATPIEEIIRRLIKKITTECQEAGTPVSDTLAAFTIKAVVLSPRHACLLENLRRETDGDQLVALCVRRLTAQHSPAAQLIRMQVFFETSYMSRGDVLADHGRTVQSRLAPVLEDIVSAAAVGANRQQLETTYRRIVALTVLVHGLGEPSQDAVEREATAALHSVFPPAELGNFLALPAEEKRLQLGELADIVAGVRLFNRHAGKGGAGIEDLPGLLERAVSATRAGIDQELQLCTLMTARYNAVIRRQAQRQQDEGGSGGDPASEQQQSLSPQFVRLCREMAAHHRQLELYLRLLLADVGRVAAQLIQLRDAMERLLRRLHGIIDTSPAVPANVVLPLFVEVADVWRGFQVETVCLSTLSSLHGQLHGFMKLYEEQELVPETWLTERLADVEVITDAEQFERNRRETAEAATAETGENTTLNMDSCEDEQDNSRARILAVERIKNLTQLPVQYNRLCPVALVDGGGQLLVGDHGLGLVHYDSRYFCCSSRAALAAFAAEPARYTAAVEERARRHAELIHLLGLEQAFTETPRPAPEPILLAERGVQTELHPEPAAGDPEYSWNEWTMRRRALLLADLRRRRTSGAQTERSHLRRDNTSQVYRPADAGTQTRRDQATKVPQPRTFLHGLRGAPDAQHGTVDLTPGIQEQ